MTKEKEEKNAEISARIAEIIERVGENPNSFAKCLGYSRAQTIYDILNGKSAPSYDFFKRFANTEISAKINLRWLLTGKGDVLKTKCSSVQQEEHLSPIFEKIIATKDFTMREQAEEIGRLKEQIRWLQYQSEEKKQAAGRSVSGTADAGQENL